jgi:hypothetical protein
MLCLKNLSKSNNLIADLSDTEVKDYVESFTHSVCVECFIPTDIQTIHCNICDRDHIIKGLRSNNTKCLII